MKLFTHPTSESEQLDSAKFPLNLEYHPAKGWYKIIYQGVIIPDLPSPLHYFNFKALTGQPNIPVLRNAYAITTTASDSVSVLSSISPQMQGQFNCYSLKNDCYFQERSFQFGEREILTGSFPYFQLRRNDDELSVNLHVYTHPIISRFNRLRLGIYEHWSLMCQCEGSIQYKNQNIEINHQGVFEYARAINIPYLPVCFYTYQIINLKDKRQLLLTQLRNHFDQVIQSKIYLRSLEQARTILLDEQVHFDVQRVYPKVKTPNHQEMYLPREFKWHVRSAEYCIDVYGQSRGDFKCGLAAGFVGSFSYQLKINDYEEEGIAGYCEYIDCRPLIWQESNIKNRNIEEMSYSSPIALKK